VGAPYPLSVKVNVKEVEKMCPRGRRGRNKPGARKAQCLFDRQDQGKEMSYLSARRGGRSDIWTGSALSCSSAELGPDLKIGEGINKEGLLREGKRRTFSVTFSSSPANKGERATRLVWKVETKMD